MSYKYSQTKRIPVAFWLLDDTAPFQEHSGSGFAGITKAGTAAPATAAPLVAGAAFSTVFSRLAQGQFTAPVFKTGTERRPFALEAWVYPIQKTQGIVASTPSRENRHLSPSFEHASSYASSGYAYSTYNGFDTTNFFTGSRSLKYTRNATPLDTTIALAYVSHPTLGNAQAIAVTPGEVVSAGAWVRPSVTCRVNMAHVWRNAAGSSPAVTPTVYTTIPANTWTWVKNENQVVPADIVVDQIRLDFITVSGNVVGGEVVNVDSVMVNSGPVVYDYFDGDTLGAAWSGTPGLSTSYMLLSSAPQQILSNNGLYDGLSIEDKIVRFKTSYVNSGDAMCQYDLGVERAAHVVGIHTAYQNQLWVDGELVDAVDLTDAQKADTYVAMDGNLYSGYTNSSQEIAVNGLAVYNTITEDSIKQNFLDGRRVVPQASIAPQFDGTSVALDASVSSIYFDRTWAVRSDFELGYNAGVNIEDTQISPKQDAAQLSTAGSWTAAMLLDLVGITSVYGVMVEWSGKNVIVEGSLDGTTWTALTSGALVPMITNGFNTTNKSLQIRARFVAGLASGEAYLESIRMIGFADNAVSSAPSRAITISYPAVPRNDYEPITYRDDNGVNLNNGILSIPVDTSEDPQIMRTLEFWVKVNSGTLTFARPSASAFYINGANSTLTFPIGQWVLCHMAFSANVAQTITIKGDAIIGQAAFYPTLLSLADATYIYQSYTGRPVLEFVDPSAITITEPASASSLYIRDWSIDSGGG
jgi:hypothetical protein